jgi:protein sidekick
LQGFYSVFLLSAEEAQKTLEESMAMDMDDRQELALELYRSRHQAGAVGPCSIGTIGRRNTLGRKTAPVHPGPPAPMMGKSPPRPSPASVAYHSDEESLKGYDENPDDSSVTEKPSEISSTDSQVRYFKVLRLQIN